jgi:hypothetical protein
MGSVFDRRETGVVDVHCAGDSDRLAVAFGLPDEPFAEGHRGNHAVEFRAILRRQSIKQAWSFALCKSGGRQQRKDYVQGAQHGWGRPIIDRGQCRGR